MLNNYDKMGKIHNKSHTKPDKQFSIIPTVLKLAGDLNNKTIIDVGCGDGFFAVNFAENAFKVYGIDNSKEQLNEAEKNKKKNIKFIFGNMLTVNYPKSYIINAPFIFGYLETKDELKKLLTKFFESLEKKGKVIGIIDNPKSLVYDNKEFGSIKIVKADELKEGVPIDIELYNNNKKLVTLHAFYHTKETIESILREIGFKEITWHKPIISEEGINIKGKDFWERYLERCDLAYFTAEK
ncbi:class I SAM-dependent methyltransferase [Candidatus Woesearchaeota archaeon]|nr:class I SAM-dependent methyltransferase [Candidatus Woesearchaeota archaeon]MBT5739997.1 class I SAM-dependent methyltransferase [Candidatus Woesearchaeota archaeon]